MVYQLGTKGLESIKYITSGVRGQSNLAFFSNTHCHENILLVSAFLHLTQISSLMLYWYIPIGTICSLSPLARFFSAVYLNHWARFYIHFPNSQPYYCITGLCT